MQRNPTSNGMRLALSIVSTAALLLAAGCSGVTVHSSTAPQANLQQYRTYAFYTSPYKQGQPQTIADQQIRGSLEWQLRQKGLVPDTTGRPDFLIAYHTQLQERVSVNDWGGYYGYYWGTAWPSITTYTEGTLVVDFIDPPTHQVFWRGTAQGVVRHPEAPDAARLDKAVAKLVNQYPSTVASVPRPAM